MKKTFLSFLICLISIASFAQVTVNQGFENSGALPVGWTASIGSGSYNWIAATSGSSPSCAVHGGSYMMEYQSYSVASGGYALLVSPVIDWSSRASAATTVTMWYYRDCAAYNTSSYSLEGVTLYVNTVNSLSGSPVSMGFVPRAGSRAISGGVTGTSTTTTSGWYQYTFTVPTTYNGNTNYLVFKAYSQDGDNQFMDDVSYTTYPCPNSAIGGYSGPICSGTVSTLTDATSGGTWSSSNSSIATIGSATGIMTAVGAGTAVISNTATCGAVVTTTVSVLASPSASIGNAPVCQGSTITLANTSGAGTWSSSAASIATVGSASGLVAGVSAGTATVTYTFSSNGCSAKSVLTVNPLPSAISGTLAVCAGTTSTLSSGTAGGTWTSSNPLLATAGPSSGIISGAAAGNPSITYTLPTGCSVSTLFTVNTQPSAITGATAFCGTQATTLSSLPTGGTWTSNNTGVAVTAGSASGVVTGISAGGAATISYTLPAGCFITAPVTVNPLGAITGFSGICVGGSTTLANTIAGGSWLSNNTAIAAIGAGTGVMAGVSTGSATISYVMPGTGCTATSVKTVTGGPSTLSVTGGGSFCPGTTGAHIGLSGSAIGFNYQLVLSGALTGTYLPGTGSALDFGLMSVPGNYTVVADPGTSCATNMSGFANIANYPLPTPYPITGGGSYCAGGAGVHIYLSGSNTLHSYQLYKNSTAVGSPITGTTGVLDFGLRTDSGTYTILATNTVTSCSNAMTGSPAIVVNPLPVSYSVSGGGGYCVGGSGMPVNLSSSATGINYQMYRGGVATGAVVAGTGLPLSFGNQTIAGNYTVTAVDASSACTNNMPGIAAVSVNPLPAAFSVTGGGAYCSGGSGVHVGVGGSAAGVSYQMQLGGVATGATVAGTGSAVDFGFVAGAGAYTVLATSAASCTRTMTGGATVTINSAPSVFSITGGGAYCSGGTGVHVQLGGSESGVSYQLYNGTAVAGAAIGTGSAIDFGLKTAAGAYTVVGTRTSTGCTGNMTGSVAVSVNSNAVYTVSGGGNVCAGSVGAHVILSGSSTGVNYQLLKGTTPVGSSVAGAGSSIDFGAQAIAGTYTVSASNTSTSCANTMSGSAVITTSAAPSIYSVTGGGSYCSGGTGVHIRLAGSNSGISYSLLNGGITAGTALSGTGAALDFGLQSAAGTYTVVATNTTTTCTVNMSGSGSVAVNPLPAAYSVTGGGSYCSGGTGNHIGLGNSVAGVTYQLYNGAVAAGAAIAGTGSVLDFGLETVAGTYTVKAVNPSTTCVNGMTGSVAISVVSAPASFSVTGGGGMCAGGAGVDVALGNSATGVRYQLYNGSAAVGAAINGIGSAIDFGLQAASGIYSVTATILSSSCSATMSGTASVSVNPAPVMHIVTGGGAYCAGGAGSIVGLDGSTSGSVYQLCIGGIPTGSAMTGTGAPLNFGAQAAAGTYTVAATDGTTGCTANMPGTATVTISTHPSFYYVTGGGGFCPGGAGVHVGLSGSNIGVDYTLYNGASTGIVVAGTGSAIDFGLQHVPGAYTATATSTSLGCSGNMVGFSSVFVTSLPSVYTATGGGAYCPGTGAGVHIGLSGSNTGISYQLYNSGTLAGTAVAGTGAALDFGVYTAGSYTVVASAGSCTNNMDGIAHATANPLPAAYSVSGGGSYCGGGAGVHVMLGGSSAGVVYKLVAAGATMATEDGNGFPLDFGVQTVAGGYKVVATSYVTSCSDTMTGTASIAINSLPAAYTVSGGGTYCASGAGEHIYLSGSASGITYLLYNGTTQVGPPMSGTGSSIDFGSQAGVGSYTVSAINYSSTCAKTMSGSATIATNPSPAAYNVTGGGSYCAGGTGVPVYLVGSNEGITYQLYNGAAVSGAAMHGTGLSVAFGTQTAAGNYTVVATDNVTGCSGAMSGSVPVVVNSVPEVFTATGSGSAYCAGGTGVAINLSNSSLGVNYQLMRGTGSVTGNVAGVNGPLFFGDQTVPGVYTVMAVIAATSCSRTMSGTIPVAVNPLPVAYNVTGGGGYCPGAGGMPVALAYADAGISYQLYRNGSAVGAGVSGSGSAIEYGVMALPGNYTVIATNTGTTCTRLMNSMAVVSVNPLPAQFAVTGGGSFCIGGAGVNVGLNGSVAGTAYQLMNGTGAVGASHIATGSPIDFGHQNVSGNYTVVATNAGSGCSGNMTGDAPVTALVLPASHAVTGGGAYCSGGIGLHVGTNGSEPGVLYSLYNSSTLVSSPVAGLGVNIDFGLQAASGTYTVMARNETTSCSSFMPGSVSIMVNPSPAEFSVTGGGNYCEGTTGIHIGLGGSVAGVSYTLFNSGSQSGIYPGTGLSLDFGLNTATGNYTVQATDTATGCSLNMAGSAVVGITPSVVPSVSISSGQGDTSCSGVAATFSAVPVNGGLSPAYQWTINGAMVSAASSYNYMPANGDNISVALTSNAQCVLPALAVAELPVTVLDSKLPAVTISANPGLEVCQGNYIAFTASPMYGGSAASFVWKKNNSVVGSGSSLSFMPSAGDVVICEMASNYQCRLANGAISTPAAIIVDSPVTPVVAVAAYPSATIASGEVVTFTATVANGGAAPTFQWYVNGVAQSGATNPSFTSHDFANGDVVSCQALSSGGCTPVTGSGEITLTVSNVSVAQVAAAADEIKVLPNPSKGNFIIKGSIGTTGADVSMEITDMLGQVIYRNSFFAANGAINEPVQISSTAPNGMYLLNIRSGAESKLLHIVIER